MNKIEFSFNNTFDVASNLTLTSLQKKYLRKISFSINPLNDVRPQEIIAI